MSFGTWIQRFLGVEGGTTEGGSVPVASDTHRSQVGPAWLEQRPGELGTDGGWLQSRWIAAYPESPVDGMLEGLYASRAMQDTDVSIHVRPRDTEATLDALENKIESLEADADYLTDRRRAGVRGVEKDLQDYQALYDTLRNTATSAFETSMYQEAGTGLDHVPADESEVGSTGLVQRFRFGILVCTALEVLQEAVARPGESPAE